MSDKPLTAMDEGELHQAVNSGSAAAVIELYNLDYAKSNPDARRGQVSAADSGGIGLALLSLIVLGAVGAVIFIFISGLFSGAEWLATESPLAPLFPAPGDPLLRVVVGFTIALIAVPGALIAVATAIRSTRMRWLSTPLVFLAICITPVLVWAAQMTSSAMVGRL